jgi:Ferritin-like domain
MSIWNLVEEFDRDGAVRETAEAAAGATRGGFLRKAGAGAAVVVGGSAFAGALPSFARAGSLPAGDVAILNFALTLEYLESSFYAEAVANKGLSGETLRFANVVKSHEAAHVAAIKKVLGSQAVAKPTFDFKSTTHDQSAFQATSDAVENLGVHAYLGQAGNIKTPAVLIYAARIMPVEARHAAWMRDIRFRGGVSSPSPAHTPAPGAFEDPFTKAQVLAAVKKTGFIVG